MIGKYRRIWAALLAALLFGTCPGCAMADGEAETESAVSASAASDMAAQKAAEPLPPWEQGLLKAPHVAYLTGENGCIRPEDPLSRGEAAALFYALMGEPEASGAQTLRDVPEDAPYREAVLALTGLGLLSCDYEGNFWPEASMTRGDFAALLAAFFPPAAGEAALADVSREDSAYAGAETCVLNGWLSCDEEGNFRPGAALRRGEAAAVNRALGREADHVYVQGQGGALPFVDLPETHWAYWDVLEAAVPHSSLLQDGKEVWTGFTLPAWPFPEGNLLLDLRLYRVDGTGRFLREFTDGVFTFGADGAYTTGDAELDGLLREVLLTVCEEGQSPLERLEAAFLYVCDFPYVNRGILSEGETGWEVEQAKSMLTLHGGNCYGYAAAFTMLARALGFDAQGISGTARLSPNASYVSHGWVEITLDGETFFCDPEGQGVYSVNHDMGYDLFMRRYGDEHTPLYLLNGEELGA